VSYQVSQARVLRSEWTKLRSLRSTVWSLLVAAALIIGLGALVSSVQASRPRQAGDVSGLDPTAISLTGAHVAPLAIGVLGVLLITGEYATGTIRASFAAVPQRLPVLWGKAIAFALTTIALCVPALLVAFFVGQSILSSQHLGTTLGEPGAARAVLGSALYVTAVGLLGLGLGALLRNTAGAIAALFGLLFALPIVVDFLPSIWADPISKYLPYKAGAVITNASPDPASLGPWTGLGVFCLYAAVVLGLAAWQLRRRDA
jgi:ABC-type transport system involved in multi-copper enzyme maturation permease subunit